MRLAIAHHDYPPQRAGPHPFHRPRIDVSGGSHITADQAVRPDIQAALAQVMPLQAARRMVFPCLFACLAGVMRVGGRTMGCTEVMSPWGDAVAGGG